MQQLPIDPLLPEIVQTIERNTLTLLEAEPGAGKTTRVPPALSSQLLRPVFVLEPRRLAARLAARRVAEETGSKLGQEIGYQVRFERVGGRDTRLWYLTEGVLGQRLLGGADLPHNAIVVLDEFHERHLETDLVLALLRRMLASRHDLRILLMSATLGAELLADQLGSDVPVLRVPGRVHPVTVSYTPASADPLDQQVAAAAARALDITTGHVLVFLPGAAEIRAAIRACERLTKSYEVLLLPLHGDLTSEEQDRAISPGENRKIIFSTNVAESSVTIEGVQAVIDSGLARILTHSPFTGIPRLHVSRVSRSSCIQRAGRAGRTSEGIAIRLYSAEDFARRPEWTPPEIVRADLAQVLLQSHAADIDLANLPWLSAPPEQSLERATRLLQRVNALGRPANHLAAAPVHPRLAVLVSKAAEAGAGELACDLAARLAESRLRLPESGRGRAASDTDVLLGTELSFAGRKLRDQLRRWMPRSSAIASNEHEAVDKAILFAFSDQIARRRGETLLLSNGASAVLDRASSTISEFLVAVEIEQRSESQAPIVRIASPIQPDWLLDMFPERTEVVDQLRWNRVEERVEQVQQLRYDKLIIDESVTRPQDLAAAAQTLLEKAEEVGLERWISSDLDRLLARIEFASKHTDSIPSRETVLRTALRQAALGLTSFQELRKTVEDGALAQFILTSIDRRLLDEIAPSHVVLPSGRRARIEYPNAGAPSVSSRLQDFVGLQETPSVANGRVPLTLCLLAPNNRPVQVTTDLRSFWNNLYPQLRRELSRRYPRHPWPENPT